MAPKTKINLKDRFENGELDLSMSDLQEVPVKEIATVKKATSLDLSNNRLITLGKTFISLTHIIKLDLSKNLLRELPEDFGEMKQLKHLDLYSNQITHLPLSFCELKNLRWLDLKNNPLVPAVAKIVGPCLDAQQCQQSARATVAFLTEMKDRVEEEKVRLREQEQRDLEAQQDKERQTKKRNDRKKAARQKKKEINKKEVEREVKEDKVAESDVLDNGSAWKNTKNEQKSKPAAIKKSRCSLFTFLLLALPSLSILFFLLSASGLLGATGDIYRGQIVLTFNRTVQNLPEPYRIYGSRFSHAVSELHTLTGRLIDNAVDVLTDAAQHRNVKYTVEVMSEAFIVGYDWSSQFFRTLSDKVLVITDEIVKKLT